MYSRLVLAVPLAVLFGCQTDTGGSGGEPLPGVASAPAAPVDIADLVGARGAGGETQLQLRGYELARTRGLTAYWWNAETRTCAQVVTANGRYESVVEVNPAECEA
ncbi:hypothetical protein [Nitratireductor alexandrii]|uniref:hypothetical protein n=1 Tax=Nitratireductor alexandrii TaxID=2448161 RepID=UPI000FD86023|nr:hypothetical protein [Nitratireductor alexandrii]